jgi:DnaK suppressor protein
VKTSTQKATVKVTAVKAKVKAAAAPKTLVKSAAPVKPAAKTAVKTPVRKAAKTAGKAIVKPLVPSSSSALKTPKKAPASPPTKTLKPAASPAKAPAVKAQSAAPVAQKMAVAAPKPASGSKAKAAPAPAPQKAASVLEAKPMTVKKAATPTPPAAPPAVTAVTPPSAPDQLVRAARPSARLAQITVPSLPPAVASTAAKASFLPSTPVATVSAPFAPIKKDPKLANNWKTKPVEELSDAEILAMPETEYMNTVQMAYFRRKLALLKQEILNSAGATTEHLREDTVVVPDPADRATIEEEHALELRTRDRERKLLKKIEQSIALIDSGEYGYCDETGEPIGVGRLLARPTATLSLEAQQRRELKQKMFGD